jgi:hypothetical protein
VNPADLSRDARLAHDALQHLDSDFYDDYDRWIQVGMSLRQLGDLGLALWHEWSSQSSKYDAAVLEAKWAGFADPTGITDTIFPGRRPYVGLGTLFKLAADNGWKRPFDAPRPIARHRSKTITIYA